eukprot:gb/GFBE01061194.1/.p1 GENE.gb/GFBE01061194.1/~~gb/GFBE01061194.1/.p1  ORF type:complete len:1132 (+),score=180.02 gb/GFBE01061194.1/:1-3396(+)
MVVARGESTRRWSVSSDSGEKSWDSPPGVLSVLLEELFEAKPLDVLTWLHEATWRLHAEEIHSCAGPVDDFEVRQADSQGQLQDARRALLRYSDERRTSNASATFYPMLPAMTGAPTESKKVEFTFTPSRVSGLTVDGSNTVNSRETSSPLPLQYESQLSSWFPVLDRDHERVPSENGMQRVPSVWFDPTVPDTAVGHERSLEFQHRWSGLSEPRFSNFGTYLGHARTTSEESGKEQKTSVIGKAVARDRGILSPVGIRLVWDLFFCLCVQVDLWLLSTQLVFMPDSIAWWGVTLNWLLVSIFCFDILLNFNTGYIEHDELILVRRRIAINYLKFWFWIDVLCTLPDLIANDDMSDVQIGLVRSVRLVKLLRQLKQLKLLQSTGMKLLRAQGFANFVMSHFEPPIWMVLMFKLLIAQVVVGVVVHFNALLWGVINPLDLHRATDVKAGFDQYGESMRQSYTALMIGAEPSDSPLQACFVVLMGIQRIVFGGLAWGWLVWEMINAYEVRAKPWSQNAGALAYLRGHGVSLAVQLKMLRAITETRMAARQQENFVSVVKRLTPTLQNTISQDLWSSRLVTFDLFAELGPQLIRELSCMVHEEILPSSTLIFAAGQASHSVYMVLEGVLTVSMDRYSSNTPDFTAGMWIGESALLNPARLRSQSLTAKTWSKVMVVPVANFKKAITKCDLGDKFDAIVEEQVCFGLCGRCGSLGLHFPSHCPLAVDHSGSRDLIVTKNESSLTDGHSGRGVGSVCKAAAKLCVGASKLPRPRSILRRRNSQEARGDLISFLKTAKLERLANDLARHGVYALDDLGLSTLEALRADPLVQLTAQEEAVLSESTVQKYRERLRRVTSRLLEKTAHESAHKHYIFLSHYKAEAAGSAALMQENLHRLLTDSSKDIINEFQAPVFLDSENLQNLGDLKQHVLHSHNFLLLLTKGVLKRPWCLLEIVLAVRCKANILPVILETDRPENSFTFPDDQYYRRVLDGEELDQDAFDFLEEQEVTLEELEFSLREVFSNIAVSFSPHKSTTIRQAELQQVMSKCHHRRDVTAIRTSTTLQRMGSQRSEMSKSSQTSRPMMPRRNSGLSSHLSYNSHTGSESVSPRRMRSPEDSMGTGRIKSPENSFGTGPLTL